VFFAPEFGGYFLEYNNFIPADPLVTPLHIAPVWYFTPFYSMLRAITAEMMYVLIACVVLGAVLGVAKAKIAVAFKGAIVVAAVVACALMLAIDAKFWGVVAMGGAVVILFFLPWLDNSPVKSIRYRPSWNKWLYAVFVINFLILGYLGVLPPSPVGERVSQVGTLFYFGFFLLMPWWSRLGEFKPVPTRVTFSPTEPQTAGVNKMKKWIVGCLMALGVASSALAAGSSFPMDKAPNLTNDMAALQNGAKLFVNHCLSCHSASFMRYNRLTDIGLTERRSRKT
jgi:hypothetical protein